MKAKRTRETGQALVLIVLAVVGMVGFAALAIDGGMVYAERRRAQNAADAAVYAAALAGAQSKSDTVAETSALKQAGFNGFTTGGGTLVSFHHPPVAPNRYAGNNNYYQVVITAEVQPIFSHFVFSGILKNTVEAIAKSTTTSPISPGNALHATGPDNLCKGIWFTGNGDTTITGANIFANSTADGTSGGSSCTSGMRDGSGAVSLTNGTVNVAGSFEGEEPYDASGCPTRVLSSPDCLVHEGVPPQEIPVKEPPSCVDYAASKHSFNPTYIASEDVYVAEPGWYVGGVDWHGSKELHFKPGLYCIDGGIKFNGGDIKTVPDPATDPDSEGVLLNILSGDVDFGGNGIINMRAPIRALWDQTDPNHNWAGMFLFMPYPNDGEISMAGGGGSTYIGTIYAPRSYPQQQPEMLGGRKCRKYWSVFTGHLLLY